MRGNKNKYEDFPIGLALFDAIPVLCFSAAMLVIAGRFSNVVFMIGAVLCALAGTCKVVWKIIIASTKKDIWLLNRQMRVVMPIGFVLIIAGLVIGMDADMWRQLGRCIISFPAVMLFAVTFAGMICMGVFAAKLDHTKVRSNWIEQITNAVAQLCMLIGVIICG